jgi:hypothetical protein
VGVGLGRVVDESCTGKCPTNLSGTLWSKEADELYEVAGEMIVGDLASGCKGSRRPELRDVEREGPGERIGELEIRVREAW